MVPMRHIRKVVLRVTQTEMAAIAKASQSTVCRWEIGELEPNRDQLARIRAEIQRRGIGWNDQWFFEPPRPAQSSVAAE